MWSENAHKTSSNPDDATAIVAEEGDSYPDHIYSNTRQNKKKGDRMSGDILVAAAKPVRDALDYWTCVATVCGAVILALYTFAAFWQVRLTRKAIEEGRKGTEKTNEIATDALVLGRRAWLVIRGHPKFGSGFWHFNEVTIENISDMPATIHAYGSGILEGSPEDLALRHEQRTTSGRFVIRGEPIALDFLEVEIPATGSPAEMWQRVTVSKPYCIIEYKDCFINKTWRTIACWGRSPAQGTDSIKVTADGLDLELPLMYTKFE